MPITFPSLLLLSAGPALVLSAMAEVPADPVEAAIEASVSFAKARLADANKQADEAKTAYLNTVKNGPENDILGKKAAYEATYKQSLLYLSEYYKADGKLKRYQADHALAKSLELSAKAKIAKEGLASLKMKLVTAEAASQAANQGTDETAKAKAKTALDDAQNAVKIANDEISTSQLAETEARTAKATAISAEASAVNAERYLLHETDPALESMKERLDSLEAAQLRAASDKYKRMDVVASDARFLYELVNTMFPKFTKETKAPIKNAMKNLDQPYVIVDQVIKERDKVALTDFTLEKSRQAVLLINSTIDTLNIAEDPRVKGKNIPEQIEGLFQILHYPEWRQERIRFSLLLNHVNVPHKGEGSPMVAATGVFRAYLTPHRFIPGGTGWYNYVRRFSTYVGVGTPLANEDSKQLADSRIYSVGLGYDLNHHFTVMAGVANYRLKNGEATSNRVNSLTLGVAINSEFFKPLLGLKE